MSTISENSNKRSAIDRSREGPVRTSKDFEVGGMGSSEIICRKMESVILKRGMRSPNHCIVPEYFLTFRDNPGPIKGGLRQQTLTALFYKTVYNIKCTSLHFIKLAVKILFRSIIELFFAAFYTYR